MKIAKFENANMLHGSMKKYRTINIYDGKTSQPFFLHIVSQWCLSFQSSKFQRPDDMLVHFI